MLDQLPIELIVYLSSYLSSYINLNRLSKTYNQIYWKYLFSMTLKLYGNIKLVNKLLSRCSSLKTLKILNQCKPKYYNLNKIILPKSITMFELHYACYINNGNLKMIKNVTNLTSLDLFECNNIISLFYLSKLTQLIHLNLTRSGIKDHSLKIKFPNLTSLDISCCMNLTDNSLKYIQLFSNLRKLNLYCDNYSSCNKLSTLTNLTDLNLNNCKLLRSIPFLKYLIKLKKLNLNNCKFIQSSEFDQLTNLTDLIELNVGNCQVVSKRILDSIQLKKLIYSHF